MANEPTFNPNAYREFARRRAAQPRRPGSLRAGLDVQGRDRVGGDRREGDADRHADRHQSGRHPHRRTVEAGDRSEHHNYGVLSFSDVIVRSSNVGAIKIGFRVGTERLSRFVSLFGFGRPVSPDFPGESPGIVWNRRKWTESALASVSMGYQVGVTPLQMVAAVSSVANGGELVEPRVIRAVYRDNRRYAVAPKVVRRTISADTAATLTDDHGRRRRRRARHGARRRGFPATRSPARPARRRSSSTAATRRPTTTRRLSASFRRETRPSRSSSSSTRRTPGRPPAAYVSAPVFKRIAEATLQYLGVPPQRRSRAAGARRAATTPACRPRSRSPAAPVGQPRRRRRAGNGAGSSRHERARGDAEARHARR